MCRRAAWFACLSFGGLLLPFLWAVPGVERLPGGVRWVLDLATHWQWAYALALALSGVLWLALSDRARTPRWAYRSPGGLPKRGQALLVLMAACSLPLWSAAPSLPSALPPSALPSSAATSSAGLPSVGAGGLRVATANLHLDNPDVAPVLRWALEQRAAVVVLHEFSPLHAAQLERGAGLAAVRDAFPYRVLRPRDDPFGRAVLSRFALDEVPARKLLSVADAPPAGVGQSVPGGGLALAEAHSTVVRVAWPGAAVMLAAVHPMPPLGAQELRERDALLSALAAALNSGPALIVGDLNATPWSAGHGKLADAGWLRATGLRGTWGPALGVAGLPLDQVLASAHWTRAAGVESGAWLPDTDHRAVLVELRLRGHAEASASPG